MDGGSSRTPEAPTAVVGRGAAVSPVACRWNPTKEQISMLETLYEQGLRTPTAEQIQDITSRLQTYGHIEGKNVFYWFQNHKARQRQKQKQDHLSLFRQYHHRHQPFLPLPPSPNVVYEPCYMAQNNIVGLYAQHPQILSPSTSTGTGTVKRRSPRSTMPRSPDGDRFLLTHHWPESVVTVAGGNNMMNKEKDEIVNGNHKETLNLFPLHPTGILQEREDTTSNAGCVASTACTLSSSGGAVDLLYFDFFS